MAPTDLATLEPRRSWEELIDHSRRRGRHLRRRRHLLRSAAPVLAVALIAGTILGSSHDLPRRRVFTVGPPEALTSVPVPDQASGRRAPGGGPARARPDGKGRPEASAPRAGAETGPGSVAKATVGLAASDRVAFTSTSDGKFAQIDVMSGDTSGRVALTRDAPFNDFSPSWSPDGRMLAYVSDRDNSQRALKVADEIYVMSADGSGERRLTHAIAGGNGNASPAWSPDGSRIAFAGDDSQGHADIWTVRPDGTGLTNLTQSAGVEDYEPTWSPDGARIAFVKYTTGPSQLWVMNADGSGQQQLTNASMSSQRPAWSPDGSHIAFDRTEADGLRHVWVMNADGSNARELVAEPGESSWPAWSPDGSQIVFGHDPNGSMEPSQDLGAPAGPGGSGALYVIALDGDGLHRLTNPTGGASDYAPSVHRP